jgi:acetyl-CoA synthetase
VRQSGAKWVTLEKPLTRIFRSKKLEHEILHGSLIDGLNGCIECCDKEAADSRVALNWMGRDAALETLSFAELQDASARFANLLRSYGIGRGDTVGVFG